MACERRAHGVRTGGHEDHVRGVWHAERPAVEQHLGIAGTHADEQLADLALGQLLPRLVTALLRGAERTSLLQGDLQVLRGIRQRACLLPDRR